MNKPFSNKFVIGALTTTLLALVALFVFSPSLLAQTENDELEEDLLLFRSVLEFIQNHYVDESKVATPDLIEGAFKGMIESLGDQHSAYLSEDEMSDMEETTTGKFGGVGLYILKAEKGIEVARPIPGTPAFRAGVTGGDIIIAVDDKPTVDLKVDEVVKLLKGVPGTKVKVTILRGEAKTLDITLSREMIELPTVKRAMIPPDIGYLEILQFTPLTFDRVKDAIEYFEEKDYKKLVIDVRSNPGGLLSSVIEIADLFFPQGTLIVSTRSRFPSEDKDYKAKARALVSKDIPIVMLIDKYSASASEILTGALKDNGRAYVMGEKSYGKASVQQIHYIGKAGFRLTIAKYYTPSGISINGVGIMPDKAIEEEKLSPEEQTAFEKLVEQKQIEAFVKKNKTPGEKEIATLMKDLKSQGIVIRDRYIRKLIRNEQNRTNNAPPEYDLEYDTVLQEAVNYLKKGIDSAAKK